ncbi:MAG: hypothetical protein JSV96_17730 [Candidatus Aminicenantes bacterium]|nr:MAG: hypothetical protein JSV96_17730 [Candidatus Aminicenantes bacterium]
MYKKNRDINCFALIAEFPPAYGFWGGTPNLIKTFFSSPSHPFCAIVVTDHVCPNPVPGPWDSIPTLSLFRPRSLFTHLKFGLGLLDNFAFGLQTQRVVSFLKNTGVKRQFVIIANNARLAIFAANLHLPIPRDIYIVDDFVADSAIYRVNQKAAKHALDRLVMESERVYTISPVYASDLEQQYGRSCEFLPIPIADSLLKTIESEPLRRKESRNALTLNRVITLHHSGQIHHLYADALVNLITLLKKIANTNKMEIHLELWGNNTTRNVEKALGINLREENRKNNFKIRICGEVSSPIELVLEQKRSDFLLLVNSFLPELEKQVRCSLSSKICEYLVSGIPILVYAPPYSGTVWHLAKHRAAHIISTRDTKEALLELEEILVPPHKNRTVEAAKALAQNLHTSKAFNERIVF